MADTGGLASGSRSRWSRIAALVDSQRVWGCWALLLALICGALAWEELTFERALGDDRRVHSAAATVTGVHDCSGAGRGCTESVVISFRTAYGREVTTKSARVSWDPEPRVGDTVTVRYNDRDPQRYVQDVRYGSDTSTIVLLGQSPSSAQGSASRG